MMMNWILVGSHVALNCSDLTPAVLDVNSSALYSVGYSVGVSFYFQARLLSSAPSVGCRCGLVTSKRLL